MEGATIQKEDFLLVLQDILPLWNEHFAEAGKGFKAPFRIDWNLAVALANQKRVVLYTVRHHGELVGYSLFILTTFARHLGTVFAVNEGIYVSPDYRNFRLVFKLLANAENDLAGIGVNAIRYTAIPSVKPDKGGVGKLYKFFSYRAVEVVYEKVLTARNVGKRKHGNRGNINKRTSKSVH